MSQSYPLMGPFFHGLSQITQVNKPPATYDPLGGQSQERDPQNLALRQGNVLLKSCQEAGRFEWKLMSQFLTYLPSRNVLIFQSCC